MNDKHSRGAGIVVRLAVFSMVALAFHTAGAQTRTKKKKPAVKPAAARPVRSAQPAWTTTTGAAQLSSALGAALSGHTRSGA